MSKDNRSMPGQELEAVCRVRPFIDRWDFNGRPRHASHPNTHRSAREGPNDVPRWAYRNRTRAWALHFRTIHASEWKPRSSSIPASFQSIRNARRARHRRHRMPSHLHIVHLRCKHVLLWLDRQRQAWLLRDAAMPRERPSDPEVGSCWRDYLETLLANRRSVRKLPCTKRP